MFFILCYVKLPADGVELFFVDCDKLCINSKLSEINLKSFLFVLNSSLSLAIILMSRCRMCGFMLQVNFSDAARCQREEVSLL